METQVSTTRWDRFAAIVRQHLGEPVPLTAETKFAEDFGADSLDMVDLIIDVEVEFDVYLPNDELIGDWKTLGDVMAWLEANVKEK